MVQRAAQYTPSIKHVVFIIPSSPLNHLAKYWEVVCDAQRSTVYVCPCALTCFPLSEGFGLIILPSFEKRPTQCFLLIAFWFLDTLSASYFHKASCHAVYKDLQYLERDLREISKRSFEGGRKKLKSPIVFAFKLVHALESVFELLAGDLKHVFLFVIHSISFQTFSSVSYGKQLLSFVEEIIFAIDTFKGPF